MITAYGNSISIKAVGTAFVYNLMGQQLTQIEVNGSALITLPQRGTYLVKVTFEEGDAVQKVYLE